MNGVLKLLHIPFSVDEIVGMPVDSFNSMLSRYYLTDLQVSLIRDIRRRGKTKLLHRTVVNANWT